MTTLKDVSTIVALLVLALFTLWVAFPPPKARCAFCSDLPCYSSATCSQGCVCLKRGMDLEGSCFSAD